MRKFSSIPFCILVVSCLSCNNNGQNLITPVTEIDYLNKSEITLQGRLVNPEIPGTERIIVADTLLLVTCNNPQAQLLVFSTNSLDSIGSFCTRGRARNEFLRLYSSTEQVFHDNGHIIIPFIDYLNEIKEVDVTESLAQGHTVVNGTAEILPFVDAMTVLLMMT